MPNSKGTAEVHKNIRPANKEYTDEEIRSFVVDLESLPGGDLTVSLLVGCGARAIPPLREYLLHGRPRGIFQPRQRAVEALAQLGAKEVLVDYLSQTREIPDAVVRHGEEAVENTAARELSRWLTDDVHEFVLRLAEHRMRVGLVETLGEFDRPEGDAVLVRALGDHFCRIPAEAALRRSASRVKPLLMGAAQNTAAGGEETPSERQRRRSALKILSELCLTETDWNALRSLLHDSDRKISVTAAEIAVGRGAKEERQEAARFLIESLPRAPWFEQIEIEECLVRNYVAVREVVEFEAARRRATAQGPPLADSVVRILEKIRAIAEAVEGKERDANAQ